MLLRWVYYSHILCARYDIDDAEKDVEELRKIRRQIRCLFGPNVAAAGLNEFEGGAVFGSLPKRGVLPTSSELAQIELSPINNKEGTHNALSSKSSANIQMNVFSRPQPYGPDINGTIDASSSAPYHAGYATPDPLVYAPNRSELNVMPSSNGSYGYDP